MIRKKETLTLSVPPGTKEQLEELADRFDIRWGQSPSPSGLVTAIAQGGLEIGQPFVLTPVQVQALQQAVWDLVDHGHIEAARSVIALLLDRGNLEAPLRQSLLRQVSQPLEGWRIRIDQLIEQKQPFLLLYSDSQRETQEFTARYAEIVFQEKRYYLQIWCDETADSADFPELKHNRCLRLDRIQGLLPTEGEWHNSLDYIEVQLQFSGRLVKAYESKPEDVQDESDEQYRCITRRVSNLFWLIRDIRRYGPECVIVSPESVRDRYRQDLEEMLSRYRTME